jgi:quinol-cytochrome oxidoreductase complex cytochrome b subunit
VVSAAADIDRSIHQKRQFLRWRKLSLIPMWAFIVVMISTLWIKSWFDERCDVDPIEEMIKGQVEKHLPKNISWFHTVESMSLFLFVSQVLTGFLLFVYYRPTAHDVFESMKFITTTARAGWPGFFYW